jgi:hypothetical protein
MTNLDSGKGALGVAVGWIEVGESRGVGVKVSVGSAAASEGRSGGRIEVFVECAATIGEARRVDGAGEGREREQAHEHTSQKINASAIGEYFIDFFPETAGHPRLRTSAARSEQARPES